VVGGDHHPRLLRGYPVIERDPGESYVDFLKDTERLEKSLLKHASKDKRKKWIAAGYGESTKRYMMAKVLK
jgi:hypothetical protein